MVEPLGLHDRVDRGLERRLLGGGDVRAPDRVERQHRQDRGANTAARWPPGEHVVPQSHLGLHHRHQ